MKLSLSIAAVTTLAALILPISGASAAGYDKQAAIGKQQIVCMADGGSFGLGPKADSFTCSEPEGVVTTCYYTDVESQCSDVFVGGRGGHSSGDNNGAPGGVPGGGNQGGGNGGGILMPAV